MIESTNPFAPPSETHDVAEVQPAISFDGLVSSDDLFRLVIVDRFLKWLCNLFVGLLVCFALAVVIILPFETPDDWAFLLLSAAILLVMAAAAAYATFVVTRRARVRRLLNASPHRANEVIRGRLDSDGILLHFGEPVETGHITWATYPYVAVNQHGIRLSKTAASDDFLAIPARIIDHFDPSSATRSIDQFREGKSRPAQITMTISWDEAPPDAFRIESFVESNPADSEAQPGNSWWTLGGLGLALAYVFSRGLVDYDSAVSVGAMVGGFLLVLAWTTKQKEQPGKPFITHHWGWISQESIVLRSPGVVWLQASSDDITEVDIVDDWLHVTMANGNSFQMNRSDLRNRSWDELCDWLRDRSP